MILRSCIKLAKKEAIIIWNKVLLLFNFSSSLNSLKNDGMPVGFRPNFLSPTSTFKFGDIKSYYGGLDSLPLVTSSISKSGDDTGSALQSDSYAPN